MPIKGRNKKAKPAAVFAAYHERPSHPRPRATETFAEFLLRLEGSSDSFLLMLIAEGYGEPSQHEYLRRLEDIAQMLYSVRDELNRAWVD